jgi:hypothetical protein
MLQRFRAWREQRKRDRQASDDELRQEQEAAEERMGIDPAEFDVELTQAETAPWRRGVFAWGARRPEVDEPGNTAPDEEPSS